MSWLRSLKGHGIHPEFVLTDKDRSEINAVGEVWPEAKHQLCFWHALCAIKQRLSQNRSTPAYYNANTASQIFDFIDVNFLPRGQQSSTAKVIWLFFIDYMSLIL